MSPSTSDNEAIQALLDERRQIESWLAKLHHADSKVPEQVRARVQTDYRKRLEKVLSELAGHSDGVRKTLQDRIAVKQDRTVQLGKLQEQRAEAELRHAVGEFDDARWAEIQAEVDRELNAVGRELQVAQEDVDKYEEVLRLIEAADQPAAPPAAPSPPRAAAVATHDITPPASEPVRAAPAAPTPHPDVEQSVTDTMGRDLPDTEEAAAAGATPGQTDAFDELAFLKSVTDEAVPKMRTVRASGAHATPPTAGASSGSSGSGSPRAAPPPSDSADKETGGSKPRVSTPFRRSSGGNAQRTLKCAECGWMNLPTEWYCERCGAELAAL